MIIVAGHFTVPAEKEGIFVAAAKEVAAETVKEPGCLFYEFWRDLADGSNRYCLLEAWESEEHLRPHLVAPHIKAFDAKEPGMTNPEIFAYQISHKIDL